MNVQDAREMGKTAFYSQLCTFPAFFVSNALKNEDKLLLNPVKTKKNIHHSHFTDQEIEGNRNSSLLPILVL